MGAAAQRRGDAVIARQSEYRYSEAEIAIAKRQILRENQLLAKQVKQQAAELDTLRAQVAELDQLRQRSQELETQLTEAQQMRDHFKGLWHELNVIHMERCAAHQKLSTIVRLALTPEEYHRWREFYRREYETA